MCHQPTVSSVRDNLFGALSGDLSLKQVVERRLLVLSKRVKFFCADKGTFVEWRWWGLNGDDAEPRSCL